MQKRNHYQVIKNQHVTENSQMLQQLQEADSNPSVRRCESPKYVFIVAPDANKAEIGTAIEEIYKERNVKVVSVNTINVKPKAKRVRGRLGKTAKFKKAIVTLEKGDSLENL